MTVILHPKRMLVCRDVNYVLSNLNANAWADEDWRGIRMGLRNTACIMSLEAPMLSEYQSILVWIK